MSQFQTNQDALTPIQQGRSLKMDRLLQSKSRQSKGSNRSGTEGSSGSKLIDRGGFNLDNLV